MSVIQLDVELSTTDLLRAAAQLPRTELKEFVRAVIDLNARQTSAVLTEKEAELLQNINRGVPAAMQARLLALIDKRQMETITPSELTELQGITAQIEALNVERLGYLTTLAQLRQVPLSQLRQELGLHATYV